MAISSGNSSVCSPTSTEYVFETTVIRPWCTYGEGTSLVHTFGTDSYYIDRIRNGKPIVVHGDGTSLWGACHRDDVAGAFANAIGNGAAYGEAYNVTSEENFTWNQYHHTVARAIGAPEPDLVHIPTDVLFEAAPDRTELLRSGLRFSTVFDNAKAKRDLGFEYTVPFEEGARRVVKRLDAEDRITDWEDEPFEDRLIDAWRNATKSVVDASGE